MSNIKNTASGRTRAGAAMIVGTSVTIQLGAALAHTLFARVGPVGVSAMRFTLGALVLIAIVRPVIRGRQPATWRAIGAYGVSLAALNITFFEAISLIPMGIAFTQSFAAPLVMAALCSRHGHDIAWLLLAGGGIVILGGIQRPASIAGVVFAIAAGCAWLGVAYAGRSVGRRTSRLDGLALALPVAALVTLPLGIAQMGGLDLRAVGISLVIAVGGLIIPFALELEGLRRLQPRTVAVIYSIDPAVAAVVGFVTLGERLAPLQLLGITAVIAASLGAAARASES